MIIVVMGVSGCGKTTVGRMLGEALGWPFFDADDFHPEANVAKMRAGIPLTDDDRCPWLDRLVAEMGAILFPLADELILTAADSPRSMMPEELAALAACGRAVANIGEALKMVAGEAAADDMIVITGSLFLVGEARAASYNRNSWPFSGAWS